ncbi:hypothetical protein [Glycomyces arizonensis]|uniref:hypothetical protein n=1 Tax=Glycomyces arizonensis TaxID=256035 RepID=UPI000417652F|nr:hypothetical protein [Glycomyces arizonensis]
MSGTDILVVGATGKTGRRVVEGLRRLGERPRAASRSGAVRFDWYDPSGWRAALDGVDRVYIAPPTVPDLAAKQVAAFARLAVDNGVRKLVLLSGRSARAGSERMLALERAVRVPGAEGIVLRPSVFDQNFSEGNLRQSVIGGTIRLVATGNAAVDFIDAADIADVAVALLTAEARHEPVYELSGPAAMSYVDAAALISKATGMDLRVVEVEPEAWAAAALAKGAPADAVDWSLEAADGVRAGFYATPFTGVQDVLGRAPVTFDAFVRAAAAAGAWS